MQTKGPEPGLPFLQRLGMFGGGALCGVVLGGLALWPALGGAGELQVRNGPCGHGPLGPAALVDIGPPTALAVLGLVLFMLTFSLPLERRTAPFWRGLIAFAFPIVVLPMLLFGAFHTMWVGASTPVGCTADLLHSAAESAKVVLRLALLC
ncbi:MAG: hypothetical protein QOI11_2744 [Candidatus Eremiobacteraeota bacterium]|jgi:hypothetical protein|nr:hypothetical protein [Candidatus Eremiobacteraeota bacterium]